MIIAPMAVVAVGLVAGPSQPVSELEATLLAIRARDSMIRSLEWEQAITIRDVDGSVIELEKETSGFDDMGRWYCERQFRSKEESGWEWHHANYSQDGLRVRAFGEAPTGLVRPTDSIERSSFPTAETFLGWFLDQFRRRSVSETIDEAKRVVAIPPARSGNRRIAAEVTLNNQPVRLEIEIDPSKDGVMTELSTFDLLLNHPAARRIVTEFQRVDGVWLPATATVEVFTWTPTDEQLVAMEEALQKAGLGDRKFDPYDPAVQAKHREIIQRVFGEKGVPIQSFGLGKMTLAISKIHSMNKPIDLAKRASKVGKGTKFYNVFEDSFEDADGRNSVPNIRPRPEGPQ